MGVEIALANRASFFSLLETLLKETFKTEIEVKKLTRHLRVSRT